MELGNVDARIITSACLCLIGLIVTGFALKVWWTPLLKRAPLFGPYLTPDGLRLVLQGWPTLFLLGALSIAGAVSRFIYWLRWRDIASDELAAVAGLVEASLSLWAAGGLAVFTVKTWLHWRKQIP